MDSFLPPDGHYWPSRLAVRALKITMVHVYSVKHDQGMPTEPLSFNGVFRQKPIVLRPTEAAWSPGLISIVRAYRTRSVIG